MSEQEKTLEALRKNAHDWVSVGWEDGVKLAIVYEDGSYELAWVSEGLASFLSDYAAVNDYDVVYADGVEQ